MKSLFIGPYSYGSTSIMRVNYIIQLLKLDDFLIIDIEDPFFKTNRVFRSLGSRLKIGPLIYFINQFVEEKLKGDYKYDFVWIDKGVFLKPDLIKKLRKSSRLLVHYTPDPAFTYHRSKLFYKALPYYDYCITTKSFEIESFNKAGAQKVIYCLQGYDKKIHFPQHAYNQKSKTVSFIGHYEKHRGEIVQALINKGIDVHIAGIKWKSFVDSNKGNSNLYYYGNGVYGKEYAEFLSSSKISLGLVSKWIPELHTTRTMEIPACGTALLTEINIETQALYNSDEAIFFENINEIPELVSHYVSKQDELIAIQERGSKRALIDGYDYESITRSLLIQIGVLE